jgi:hypothetical protein
MQTPEAPQAAPEVCAAICLDQGQVCVVEGLNGSNVLPVALEGIRLATAAAAAEATQRFYSCSTTHGVFPVTTTHLYESPAWSSLYQLLLIQTFYTTYYGFS